MSGGVDSSVSAALLAEHGCKVEGGFIVNWSDSVDLMTGECQWRGERRDAIRVAAQLGIPLHTFNFEEMYRERVIERMFAEYKQGITPNPDILCNEEIKFGLFLEKAKELGFDYVATGHYAQIYRDEQGKAHLIKGADPLKDQTYFLHRISRDALQKSVFPIGQLQKAEVRQRAETLGLSTAKKPDSQGICFVGKLDFHEFIRKKNAPTPGNIIDKEGKILGTHDGLDTYTIGQRHGFFVSKDSTSWYVAQKRIRTNELVIVNDREDLLLYTSRAIIQDMHWLSDLPPLVKGGMPEGQGGSGVRCAIRYRQEPVPCLLSEKEGKWIIEFTKPVWALAPGQSAVLYLGDECLGGGFLAESPLDSSHE